MNVDYPKFINYKTEEKFLKIIENVDKLTYKIRKNRLGRCISELTDVKNKMVEWFIKISYTKKIDMYLNKRLKTKLIKLINKVNHSLYKQPLNNIQKVNSDKKKKEFGELFKI